MDQGKSWGRWPQIGAAMLLALAMLAAIMIGWTGFIASDDSLYFVGADHWLTDPPFAGDNHWSTRFPLLWSFAVMLLLFGRGYAAFAATALLWYGVLVALVGLFATRMGGARAGWIAALLAATLPVVISNATTVSVDLLETSLLLGGAWLLGEGGSGRVALARGATAGACFGLAILCRETSLLSLVALAPLFLIGRPVSRGALIAAGVGLMVILGGEALFQWLLMGEPLRRYDIAFHHDSHIDRAANLEGNFLIHPAIDPVLVLFINDDFGLLFWVASLAALVRGRHLLPKARSGALIVLATMAAADFALVAVLTHKLVLNPRYFMLPAILAIVIVALWLARSTRWWRWPLLAGLVAINLLMLSVGNAHPRWEMDSLLAASQAFPREMISGDPVMVRRARLPLRFAGRANLRYAPALPGGLVVAPESIAPRGLVLAHYPSPPTRLGGLIEALGGRPFVPPALRHRMFAPNQTMLLVRTPR
ncbi:hypothetical protein [Sphingomonas sp. 28-63-12]|uniref:hypothetical protein n=1 Tax=Sphingomonas sp. 28-63-12 TaxID=1970434 RepID=UPI000BC69315|nr:MAG: hypothetical protein B7Y47_07840 [Sphingomonas sp. 28-63-12]